MKGNNYPLDFLRGSAQFRIITESLEVINTGACAHLICQLRRSAQDHRGPHASFCLSGPAGDGGECAEGLGVTFAVVNSLSSSFVPNKFALELIFFPEVIPHCVLELGGCQ